MRGITFKCALICQQIKDITFVFIIIKIIYSSTIVNMFIKVIQKVKKVKYKIICMMSGKRNGKPEFANFFNWQNIKTKKA